MQLLSPWVTDCYRVRVNGTHRHAGRSFVLRLDSGEFGCCLRNQAFTLIDRASANKQTGT